MRWWAKVVLVTLFIFFAVIETVELHNASFNEELLWRVRRLESVLAIIMLMHWL